MRASTHTIAIERDWDRRIVNVEVWRRIGDQQYGPAVTRPDAVVQFSMDDFDQLFPAQADMHRATLLPDSDDWGIRDA
jgi:hypothetical protein